MKTLTRRDFLKICGIGAAGTAATLALTSCGEKEEAASDGKKTIVVGLNNDVATLGPFDLAQMGAFCIQPMFYMGLFQRDQFASDTLLPQIGKEYKLSDDGLTITVEMFDYVKDSAGNTIDADDVIFTWNYKKESGQYESVMKYIDSVTKLGDYTVEFKINELKLGIYADILSGFIVDSTWEEALYQTEPVSTGPYVVTQFAPSSSITFTKNEDWWQTDEKYIHPEQVANADVIEVKIIVESAQIPIALESGDIDMCTGLTFANARDYFMNDDGSAVDGYNVYTWSSHLIRNIAFNLSDESILKDNIALRQAICYAINNEELVQGVLQGAGTTLCTYGTSVYGDYNSAWETEDYYDYDVEKAKAKLAEAGYAAGEVTLTMISQTNDTFKKAMEMMKQYLSVVGINLEIIQYDAALYATYKLDFSQWDLLLDNQANSTAMTSIWNSFLRNTYATWKDVGVSVNGDNNEELTAMINEVNTPAGHTPENINKCHYYIKDNVLIYGLWAEQSYAVSNTSIADVYINTKLYVTPGPCVLAD